MRRVEGEMVRARFITPWLVVACLPAAALIVIWVRSYRVADSFWSNTPGRVRAVVASSGKLEWFRQTVTANAPWQVVANAGHRGQAPSTPRAAGSGLATAWDFLGFGYTAGPEAFGSRRVMIVPFWALTLVAGVPPIVWAERRRRGRIRRLLAQRRCVRCGYDLRATPERCPECGEVMGGSGAEGGIH